MHITTTEHVERYVTFSLSGHFDAFHSSKVQARLEQLYIEGVRHFVFDLSRVEFLDSAGLAVLVTIFKHVQQEDGSVKMVPPESPGARRILRLTHFDRIFEMVTLQRA